MVLLGVGIDTKRWDVGKDHGSCVSGDRYSALGTWGRMMVLVGGGYRHSDRQGLGEGSWFWWAWG